MLLAIIDEGINLNYINTRTIHHYSVVMGKSGALSMIQDKYINFRLSHGTICAKILTSINSNIELIDIKILDSLHKASLKQLIYALEWCYANSVRIINMSLGTLNYRDANSLSPIISQLLNKGIIIIAAVHNSGLRSYPACMPGVFGVRCDNGENMLHGEYTIDICPRTEIENCLVAHINNEIFTGATLIPNANSYAAPIITGHVSKYLEKNQHANFGEVLSYLQTNGVDKEYKVNKIRGYFQSKYSEPLKTPIIAFINCSISLIKRIQDLFEGFGYYPEVFSDNDSTEAFIPLCSYLYEDETINMSLLSTLEKIYDPDVIILLISDARNYLEISGSFDIIVRSTDHQYELFGEQFSKMCKTPKSLFNGILSYFTMG